jgi:nucleoside phosphorylase
MLDITYGPLQFQDKSDSNSYLLGKIANHCIAIASPRAGSIGNTPATAIAINLLRTFCDIRVGFMVGIAGGIPSQKYDVRLGDVAVSYPSDNCGGVRQHDFGKALEGGEFRRTGFLNRPPNSILSAVGQFRLQIDLDRTRFPRSVRDALEKDNVLKNKCSPPDPKKKKKNRLFKANQPHPLESTCAQHPTEWDVARAQLASDAPNVHYGTVVSGNSVVKSAAVRDSLLRDIPDAVCVEMEASGLMNDFPCIIVRGICDYCDSHKNDQWHGYAALTAAAYAKELLEFLPAQEVAEEVLALKVYRK